MPRFDHDADDDAAEFSRSNDDRDQHDEDADDADLQAEARVTCPYCGEDCEITLDPHGGATQQYVEDCPVCCRPWSVHVAYNDAGAAEAWLEEPG